MTNEIPNTAPQFWAEQPAVIGGGANLSPGQANELASEMVRHGSLTREQADAALRSGGNEPAPPDARSDEARAYDASFAPAAAPEDYKLDYQGKLMSGTDPATVANFNSVATNWLHEIGMPPGVGASVIERAMEVGQRAARMTAPELELWKISERLAFDSAAKTPERAALLRACAEQVLASASKRADFSNGLRQSPGALYDAITLMNLALHGERVQLRSKL